MDFSNFSQEQLDAMSGIHSADQLFEYVKDEGIELTDEQLQAISGGEQLMKWRDGSVYCPQCERTDPASGLRYLYVIMDEYADRYVCPNCGRNVFKDDIEIDLTKM